VRAILATAAIIAVLGVPLPASALGGAAPSAPTPAQIRAAVKSAERSRELWATVNICDQPNFGIRGQMPALGFPARMSMQIQVDYWNPAKKRFVPDSHAIKKLTLPRATRNLHQTGYVWQFQPATILSGSVTFEWKLGNKVIGRTTRATAHVAKGVDDTNPRGNSTASCKIS
jgi:hypothetical protein